jgi:DUF1365 family protein
MNQPAFSRPDAPVGHSPFVPMLLAAVALAAWFGFQTQQLVRERSQLATLHTTQDAQVDAATKLRASLDAVAAATAKLADAGNVNARLLVEELRKRGITINPNVQPAAPK